MNSPRKPALRHISPLCSVLLSFCSHRKNIVRRLRSNHSRPGHMQTDFSAIPLSNVDTRGRELVLPSPCCQRLKFVRDKMLFRLYLFFIRLGLWKSSFFAPCLLTVIIIIRKIIKNNNIENNKNNSNNVNILIMIIIIKIMVITIIH